MEEWVGAHWDRWVTQRAAGGFPAAAVQLADVMRPVQLLLHAAGATQRVAVAAPVAVGGPRSFWQRVAGAGRRLPLPQLDAEVLALPARVALFDDAALNRSLYLWWAALAGGFDLRQAWAAGNLQAMALTMERFPGLAPRARRLIAADLERQDLHALQGASPREHAPVWSWLLPVATAAVRAGSDAAPSAPRPPGRATAAQRRRAREQAQGEARAPLLLAPKGESLKTFADAFHIDRGQDDEPDDDAAVAAEEIETLSLQRAEGSVAARVRFDLDLPSAAADDLPVGPGERFPEWDPRRQCLQPGRVAAQTYRARPDAGLPWVPPPALRAQAARIRRRLEVQRAAPRWQRGLPDGEDLDLDALVRHRGQPSGKAAVYQRRERSTHELATLLLADLSLSTDAHANDTQRVIDVIRDALYVFGEALAGSGDAFSVLGFSSVRRQLRLHELKGFDERWNDGTRQRLAALKPGYYTRMGAALRAATRRLSERPERQRLLLLLTDGKPHDLDGYDGRLGQEDTKQAVLAARRAGLLPFAISIDEQAPEVLPQLFGSKGWAWVRRPEDLPQRLAGLYAQLTA
ncbi:MAG: VWA domain-containing protein [Rubrivivax sp.]|nr:VWA domain-containing protein [Rubrivivax sp.]